MTALDLTRHASLVFSLHAPRRSTVGECLRRWSSFDQTTRAASYLVVEGDLPGTRQTINASGIADLADQSGG